METPEQNWKISTLIKYCEHFLKHQNKIEIDTFSKIANKF